SEDGGTPGARCACLTRALANMDSLAAGLLAPRGFAELAVQAASELDQLDECAGDDAGPGARRAAGGPREVADRQLLDAEAESPRLDQELRAERRAPGMDRGGT